MGAINCLGLAKRTQARVFQASTSEVYGDPEIHPQPESYWGNVNPIGIRSCYDEGKRCAETLFMDYHRQNGVDVRIVRIFNTYGPRMNAEDGRVVSNFIVQALKGEDITIYGDGTQTRSFCYVDDLIAGFMSLMESDYSLPMNIGNPGEFTMLELAEEVLKQVGGSSKLVFQDLPSDDPRQRKPDITLATEKLNWEPQGPSRGRPGAHDCLFPHRLGTVAAYFDWRRNSCCRSMMFCRSCKSLSLVTLSLLRNASSM